ncbi:PH domain-containing protein [Peteryoungia desertarenae]|uniref:PH domain-containing protein n=1 Tax=Peteryoungia desertarenae TaxID=1813451 RepID=A0ABX6QJH8_9HYPH|nr:photosynthetic complex putative assembly protein PuhB [Peteryoungia desertarenae]QLF68491.1 PH domain-containing protein [Peteryoungia desertarenae]
MTQFVAREHEYEPVPGLPGKLPAGETILWQGRPSAALVSRHLLKVRWIGGYFVVLALWAVIAGLYDGQPLGGIVFSVAVLTALAAVLVAMLELFAWAVEKTTLYTITTERVVIRFGVALSMTVNLPYRRVGRVSIGKLSGPSGSMALALLPDDRLSWLIQWPHVRAWRFSHPEPSLICLADAEQVSDVLALAILQYRQRHPHASHSVGSSLASTAAQGAAAE